MKRSEALALAAVILTPKMVETYRAHLEGLPIEITNAPRGEGQFRLAAMALRLMANAIQDEEHARDIRVLEKRARVNAHIERVTHELDAYKRALKKYPDDNPQLLQARKVCRAVEALAAKLR